MMYYKKKNIRYTDMCIWIDEHANEIDCDDETLFEYLYLILVMLVRNNHDFKNDQQYNDFGIFGASYMYFRYLTKRRKYWDAKTDEERDGIKIKSCLNYVKSILPFLRIRFQDEVLGIYKPLPKDDEEEQVQNQYLFSDELSQIVDEIALCDFRLYLDDIPKTVRNFLQKIPMCKNSFEWDNIYVSVLLTLINQMTINEKIKKTVTQNKTSRGRRINQDNVYSQMRENPVILYRVDKSMENYILTLAREVKHIIAKDLSEMSDVYIPADDRMAIEIIEQLMGEEDEYGDSDAGD